MATTVTYKGATLTTITNDTATLETAGTWLEDDITITDSSGGGTITVVDVPNAYGGIEKQITAVDISDTTAQAADVASGKYFYTAAGVKTAGTASVGGWSADGIAQNTEPNGVITLSNSVTTLGRYAFAYKPITGITANGVTTVYQNAFYNSHLTSIHLPLATADGNYTASVFESCASLTTAVLPAWNKPMYSTFFASCTALEAADIYGYSFGGSYVFRYCTALKTLVLRSPSVVTLNITNHFNDSSFASGGTGGTLYVPNALISSYQSASNWSTILGYANNQIKAIEGSYYETHYADGTVI